MAAGRHANVAGIGERLDTQVFKPPRAKYVLQRPIDNIVAQQLVAGATRELGAAQDATELVFLDRTVARSARLRRLRRIDDMHEPAFRAVRGVPAQVCGDVLRRATPGDDLAGATGFRRRERTPDTNALSGNKRKRRCWGR